MNRVIEILEEARGVFPVVRPFMPIFDLSIEPGEAAAGGGKFKRENLH